MTRSDVEAIVAWRYEAPYDFYDWAPQDDPREMLDPATGYVAVTDGAGDLAGFFCFGPAAQVPGGQGAGLYDDDAIDVGLGLRPDLTGQGLGLAFVECGLDYATARFGPTAFRLSVATFNERAIRVYERAGFRRGTWVLSPVRGAMAEFVLMHRPAEPPMRPPGATAAREDRTSDR